MNPTTNQGWTQVVHSSRFTISRHFDIFAYILYWLLRQWYEWNAIFSILQPFCRTKVHGWIVVHFIEWWSFNFKVTCQKKKKQTKNILINLMGLFKWLVWLCLWSLTLLSAIFQLYRGGQFYCRRKPKYPEKTTDLSLTNFIT